MSTCMKCKHSRLSEHQHAMLCKWDEARVHVVLPASPKCENFDPMSADVVPPPKDAKAPGRKYQSLDSFMRETFSDEFLEKASHQYTLAQISGRVFDATAKHIDFDPDAFAQGYVDLLHEVEQLRKHRVDLLGKYEQLRAKMQQLVVCAEKVESCSANGTRTMKDVAVCELVQEILK